MVPALRMSTVMGLKDACCQALDVDQGEVEIAAYPGMTGQPQSVSIEYLVKFSRILAVLGAFKCC